MLSSHHIIDGFLGARAARELLAFAVNNHAEFEPARIYDETRAKRDDALRTSLRFRGSWKTQEERFRAKALETLEEITRGAGHAGFCPDKLELELAAHGDGGRFRRHIDTVTAKQPQKWDRVVSTVYYFSAQPARFSGGNLVLHALIGEDRVTIEPRHDRLVIFSSIAPHEVTPTRVPSGAFADFRFSINCWFVRARSPV
mgnify:FL=1